MNERTKKVLPVFKCIRAGPLSQPRGGRCVRQLSIIPEHSKVRNTDIPIKHLTKVLWRILPSANVLKRNCVKAKKNSAG